MTLKIYKYPIELKDDQEVYLPEEAEILRIDDRFGVITIWALVDTDNPHEKRRIKIYGTGHDIKEEDLGSLEFVNTIFQGTFVWHVYQGKPIEKDDAQQKLEV